MVSRDKVFYGIKKLGILEKKFFWIIFLVMIVIFYSKVINGSGLKLLNYFMISFMGCDDYKCRYV